MGGTLNLRKIGGSDLAVIAGVKTTYATPASLALRLRTGERPEQSAKYDWIATRGQDAEPRMRSWFEEHFDCRVVEVDPLEGKWWRASPDGLVARAGLPDELLELKHWELHRRFEFGEPGTDQLPVELTLQVQWYLRALRLEWANVAVSFADREPEVWRIRADEELQRRIGVMAYRFYELAMRTEPVLIPTPAQPEPERVQGSLPDLDTIAKVRYLAKAQRVAKKADARFQVAREWAFSVLGHKPGRIDTPTHTVSVYYYRGDVLALRVTEKKA